MPALAATDPLAESLAVSLYDQDPDLAEGVLAEFRRGWEAALVLAKVRQARIAEATARIRHAAVDGIGQMTMVIDADAYHYWGTRLGYQCWQDAGFRREFRRDNPEVRVRTEPRTATIVKSRDLSPAPGAIVLTDRRGAVVA